MSAYIEWQALQKRHGGRRPKTRFQRYCPHESTYLTNTRFRDYPDGEWITLPEYRVCRRCFWPEPV